MITKDGYANTTYLEGVATTHSYLQLNGLSTDEKPTVNVGNGSVFFEIDTGKAYMYDQTNSQWREL